MIRRAARHIRYRILSRPAVVPSDRADISETDRNIIDQVKPYTMTSTERILALIDSVRYAVRRDIAGDFVECGVWRGGSVLAIIQTLLDEGVTDRDIWLYDTFEGMTAPTEEDTSPYGEPATETWKKASKKGERVWDYVFGEHVFNEEGVRELLTSTGYPSGRLHFVRGPVEDTVPDNLPETISLLRLDTDFYSSTLHELVHMYPLVSEGGVLILDDYGHWSGAQQAADEYFAKIDTAVLMTRIDYSGRVVVKQTSVDSAH